MMRFILLTACEVVTLAFFCWAMLVFVVCMEICK